MGWWRWHGWLFRVRLQMAPLSQSFVRTIAMQKFVNEVNSKLIRGWMQTDSAYQVRRLLSAWHHP